MKAPARAAAGGDKLFDNGCLSARPRLPVSACFEARVRCSVPKPPFKAQRQKPGRKGERWGLPPRWRRSAGLKSVLLCLMAPHLSSQQPCVTVSDGFADRACRQEIYCASANSWSLQECFSSRQRMLSYVELLLSSSKKSILHQFEEGGRQGKRNDCGNFFTFNKPENHHSTKKNLHNNSTPPYIGHFLEVHQRIIVSSGLPARKFIVRKFVVQESFK